MEWLPRETINTARTLFSVPYMSTYLKCKADQIHYLERLVTI
jgi:hypothetical protein